MEHLVNIYDIQENGRCKADLQIPELNLVINGFRVVPGTTGKGVIVHMPKGMGTDWKYSEIAWPDVREMISSVYLENPQIREIYISRICGFSRYTDDIISRTSGHAISLYFQSVPIPFGICTITPLPVVPGTTRKPLITKFNSGI